MSHSMASSGWKRCATNEINNGLAIQFCTSAWPHIPRRTESNKKYHNNNNKTKEIVTFIGKSKSSTAKLFAWLVVLLAGHFIGMLEWQFTL